MLKSIRRGLAALAAAGAVAAAAAPPAQAGLLTADPPGCTDAQSARVFLPWLDPADYFLAPGGDAESARGWTLTGNAAVVAGNEPWHLSGAGQRSIAIPAGSSATTARVCVGLENPTLRLFAKRSGGGLLGVASTLLVEVVFKDAAGRTQRLPIGAVLGGSSWQPSLPLPIVANLLPALTGDKAAVAFRFTPVGTASWQIDDVYVDPWRAR